MTAMTVKTGPTLQRVTPTPPNPTASSAPRGAMRAPAVYDELCASTGRSPRAGQRQMIVEVAQSITGRTDGPVVIEAPTGTGKSLGYLLPLMLARRRSIIATATKALQDQILNGDAPALAEDLRAAGHVPASVAVLKGRGSYACLAKIHARPAGAAGTSAQGALDLDGDAAPAAPEPVDVMTSLEVAALRDWARSTSVQVGDESEPDFPFSKRAWAEISTSATECPGQKCPMADECFANRAAVLAQAADILIVNQHLLASRLREDSASGLSDRATVVIDEAHDWPAIAATSLGVTVGTSRLSKALKLAERYFDRDDPAKATLTAAADTLIDALNSFDDGAPAPASVTDLCAALSSPLSGAARAAGKTATSGKGEGPNTTALIAEMTLSSLVSDLEELAKRDPATTTWIATEGRSGKALHSALLEPGPVVLSRLGLLGRHDEDDERADDPGRPEVRLVLTSATLSVGKSFEPAARAHGLAVLPRRADGTRRWKAVEVPTPFDYQSQGVLYLPAGMPDMKAPGRDQWVREELARLVNAAGGRTLGLFTSMRALSAAAEHLREHVDVPVLVQGEDSVANLVAAFAAEPETVLLGSRTFMTGVDIPGPSLSCCVLDRVPFPRPDDPLATARRELADRQGRNGFTEVYVAAAAMQMSQAVGRLIRRTTDRGVAAIFDDRVGRPGYGKILRDSLPDMRVIRNPQVVYDALGRLDAHSKALEGRS